MSMKKHGYQGCACAAIGCNLRAKTNLFSTVKMIPFPKDPELQNKWLAAMRRKDWKPKKSAVLCNRHFVTGKPSKDPQHPDYVPSLFSFNKKGVEDGRRKLARYERSVRRMSTLPSTTSTDNVVPEQNTTYQPPLLSLKREIEQGPESLGSITKTSDSGKPSAVLKQNTTYQQPHFIKKEIEQGSESQSSVTEASSSDSEEISKKKSKDMFKRYECSYCKAIYSGKYYLQKHIKAKHPEQVIRKDKPFKCSKCERAYEESKNLKKHERLKHGAPPSKRQSRLICFICSQPYATLERLCSHITEYHDIEIEREYLEFADESDFLHWKNNEELESNAAFVKHGKSKHTKVGELSNYYFCRRSGFFRRRGGKYLMKAQGSCKIGGFCTAHMKVKIKVGGEHLVQYIKTHVGHSEELEHLWLSKAQKDELAVKIKNQVPFDEILNEVRSAPLTSLNRIHLLSRKDLYNIRREYGLDNSKAKRASKAAKSDPPMTNLKKNIMRKMRELEKRHRDSLSLCDQSVITYQDSFIVPSNTDDDEMYVVQLNNSDCDCKLKCKDCCVCVHNFTCSCPDAKIGHMCKHIHLVCRINKVSEETEEDPYDEA